MLKKILIVVFILLIGGGVYSYMYLYKQWNTVNSALDSTIKNEYIFIDLCRKESKDDKCYEVVHHYFKVCNKSYSGKKITLLNTRDEGLKYIKAVYSCIETRSHYKLPSLGDYLLDSKSGKNMQGQNNQPGDTNTDVEPSAASLVNLAAKKGKFFRQSKEGCLKTMTSLKPEPRERYCECAVSIIRANMKDRDFRLFLDKKINFFALMDRTNHNFNSCR